MTTTNFSTIETLDQLNNASLLDLSFDFSPVIPATPCTRSPIIGAQQNKDRGKCNRECDAQHDMETIEILETENISLPHNENELVTNPQQNVKKFPVINETLRSQGYGTVFIIKPTANNVKDLINNHIEIIKSTKNSFFNCSEVKDIRVNKRKNLLVAEMKENWNNFLKLKSLEHGM